MAPDVPDFRIDSLDSYVGDNHPNGVERLALELNARLLAHRAVPPIAPHDVMSTDGLAMSVAYDHGRHALIRLCEAFKCGTELHAAAKLR